MAPFTERGRVGRDTCVHGHRGWVKGEMMRAACLGRLLGLEAVVYLIWRSWGWKSVCVSKYTRGRERCAECRATKCCYYGRECKQRTALRGAVRGGAVGREAPGSAGREANSIRGTWGCGAEKGLCLRVEGAWHGQSLWEVPCILDGMASFALGHPEVIGILHLGRDAFGGEMKRGWSRGKRS